MMKTPNIQNIQGNGRSRRWRTKYTSTTGMAKYASQISPSETLWSQTSPAVQPSQLPRGWKSDASKRRIRKSIMVTLSNCMQAGEVLADELFGLPFEAFRAVRCHR
jgi:hypothetical protein